MKLYQMPNFIKENIRDEYDPYPKEVILQIWDKLMVDRK